MPNSKKQTPTPQKTSEIASPDHKKELAILEKIHKIHTVPLNRVIDALDAIGIEEFVRYCNSPWRIMWNNLLAGIFRGLGIIVGMTLVFAILIWFLGQLGFFPVIGDYFLQLKQLLETLPLQGMNGNGNPTQFR